MRIAIEGCAAVGSFGFGRRAFARALETPPQPEYATGNTSVLPKADVSIVASYVQARALRQVDHFTRMALIGAFAALADAGREPEDMRDQGLVVASGYGPAQMTFAFLDSIEDHGANMASPLAFSFSVHNIPAANVALKLGMAGPCATVCQFESSVASALLTAAAWLAEGRVSRVLFGAVDELTPVLAATTARFTRAENSGDSCGRRDLPLGEGAAFFCLSLDNGAGAAGAKAVIENISLRGTRQSQQETCVPEPPAIKYHSGSLRGLPEPLRAAAMRRIAAYGSIPVAQAFDMYAATLALENGDARQIICASSAPGGAESAITLTAPGVSGK
ncbi:MAG: hypothetical protein DELT_00697 [Desulfovibrio sp.]